MDSDSEWPVPQSDKINDSALVANSDLDADSIVHSDSLLSFGIQFQMQMQIAGSASALSFVFCLMHMQIQIAGFDSVLLHSAALHFRLQAY